MNTSASEQLPSTVSSNVYAVPVATAVPESSSSPSGPVGVYPVQEPLAQQVQSKSVVVNINGDNSTESSDSCKYYL